MAVDLDVQIVNSVLQVGQEAWDRLSGNRPFGSYRWYSFGEKAMSYAKAIHVLVSYCGEFIARATFWLTGHEVLPIEPLVIRRALQCVFRRWPLLICQAPLSSTFTSGLILPDPPLRQEALDTVIRVARQLLAEQRASFCLFPYLASGAQQEPWPGDCLWIATSEPGTVLNIFWPDFESYLRHLGKKRRYNLRRSCRLAEESGIQIRYRSTVSDVDRAMALHENVNRRYGSQTEPWMRGAFEHAAMVDAVWLAAERDDCVVGCELMLGDNDAWFVTGLGLETGIEHVYFQLGYHDIKCAIERGAKFLRWGSGAYDLKRRFGFEPEDNRHIAALARGRVLQVLGCRLAARERRRVLLASVPLPAPRREGLSELHG